MILNCKEGLERFYCLKKMYPIEIELLCANSNYCKNIEPMMSRYKALAEKYPSSFLLKESEAHEPEFPYYEASMFCNKENLDQMLKMLASEGISVDIVHDND